MSVQINVASSTDSRKSAASSSPKSARSWRGLSVIVLLTTAAALGFALWVLSRQLAPEITAPASAESAYVASFPEKSVAVLPFENLGQPNESALASEAVQDDIINALSKIKDLRVISRT